MLSFGTVFFSLGLDPAVSGLQVVVSPAQRIDPQGPILVPLTAQAAGVLGRLRRLYQPAQPVRLVPSHGAAVDTPLAEVEGMGGYLYIPPIPWQQDLRTFGTLAYIIARLRAPDGCPWDREQTHQSIARYLLEETHEALEALDKNDMAELPIELGDVLLQVVLHAQIAEDSKTFTIEDVLEAVSAKLVRRHPHVFGDAVASTAAQVEANWEAIKSKEKGRESLMDGVPAALPALAFAQRVQGRASGVGFDTDDLSAWQDKVREEVAELAQAATDAERAAELGDVLFSLVNLGRKLGVDVEGALRQANSRFVERFRLMEKLAAERGQEFAKLPLADKDDLWTEAKQALRTAH